MENEYIIVNKTSILKRIKELDKGLETKEEDNFEIDILKTILSQSTSLIPEIEKAWDKCYENKEIGYCINKQDYISNLKLNI